MTRNSILGYYPYTLFQTLPFEKPEGSIAERTLPPQKNGEGNSPTKDAPGKFYAWIVA